MQEAEKISVAKPVASRPLSKFTSYPHLMTEAMNSPSSPSSLAEKTIAIKPKTVRFRPMPNSAPEAVTSKDGFASSEKASVANLTADFGSNFLYKPTAKVVSATKASPLTNPIESYNGNCHEGSMNMQAPVDEPNLIIQHITNQHQNSSSYADISQICEPSSTASQDMELDMKIQHQGGDRLSYDGYNWRKYGQKQVKGSEYPRSYYKCTHPSCPVKKNVERSLDGQIAEIVYKGEHNHPKPPQPLKKLSLSSQGQSMVSDEQGREGNLLQTIPSGWNMSAGMMNNCNEMGIHLTANCAGRSSDQAHKAGSRVAHVDGDKLDYKRRKEGDQVCGANIDRSDGAAGCNHITQNSTDTGILGDGFHWRKYGQKVVKGNSYPRSYYRCTNPRCNVRKYVERVSDESESFVTRYEGKHNHDMPNRK